MSSWSAFFSMNMAALFSPFIMQRAFVSLPVMRRFSVVPILKSSEIFWADSIVWDVRMAYSVRRVGFLRSTMAVVSFRRM
jgi:hypothetical protein